MTQGIEIGSIFATLRMDHAQLDTDIRASQRGIEQMTSTITRSMGNMNRTLVQESRQMSMEINRALQNIHMEKMAKQVEDDMKKAAIAAEREAKKQADAIVRENARASAAAEREAKKYAQWWEKNLVLSRIATEREAKKQAIALERENKKAADAVTREIQRMYKTQETEAKKAALAQEREAKKAAAVMEAVIKKQTHLTEQEAKKRMRVAEQEARKAEQAWSSEMKRMQHNIHPMMDGLISKFSSFGSVVAIGIGTAAVALASFTVEATKTAMVMQRFEVGLQSVLKSSYAATRELSFVRKEADRLGLVYMDQIKSYTLLTASAKGTTLSLEQVREVYTSISEAGRALALDTNMLNRAFLAISQIMSKGKVQAEEIRGQLGEALPGAFGIAAEAMNMTTAQLSKALELGKVYSDDFLPKFAAAYRKHYAQAATEASNIFVANIARMQTAWQEFQLEAATEFFSSFEKGLGNFRQWMDDNKESIKEFAQGVGSVSSAFAQAAISIMQLFDTFKKIREGKLSFKEMLFGTDSQIADRLSFGGASKNMWTFNGSTYDSRLTLSERKDFQEQLDALNQMKQIVELVNKGVENLDPNLSESVERQVIAVTQWEKALGDLEVRYNAIKNSSTEHAVKEKAVLEEQMQMYKGFLAQYDSSNIEEGIRNLDKLRIEMESSRITPEEMEKVKRMEEEAGASQVAWLVKQRQELEAIWEETVVFTSTLGEFWKEHDIKLKGSIFKWTGGLTEVERKIAIIEEEYKKIYEMAAGEDVKIKVDEEGLKKLADRLKELKNEIYEEARKPALQWLGEADTVLRKTGEGLQDWQVEISNVEERFDHIIEQGREIEANAKDHAAIEERIKELQQDKKVLTDRILQEEAVKIKKVLNTYDEGYEKIETKIQRMQWDMDVVIDKAIELHLEYGNQYIILQQINDLLEARDNIEEKIREEERTKELEKQRKEIEKQRKEIEKQQKSYEDMLENIQKEAADVFYNMFENIGDGWDNLLDSMKKLFFRTIANMTAQAIMEPIIIPVIQYLTGALGGSVPGAMGTTGMSGGQGMGGTTDYLGMASSAYSLYSNYTGGGLLSGIMNTPAWGPGSLIAGGASSTMTGTIGGLGIGNPGAYGGTTAAGAPSLGQLGMYGALGSIGYTTVGDWIGLPQGPYSGVGAGLGAAAGGAGGAALGTTYGFMGGGVYGAVIGAVLGGLLSSFIPGKKPPKMKAGGMFELTPDIMNPENLFSVQMTDDFFDNMARDGKTELIAGMETGIQNALDIYRKIYVELPEEMQDEIFSNLEKIDLKIYAKSRKTGYLLSGIEDQMAEAGKELSESIAGAFRKTINADYLKEEFGTILGRLDENGVFGQSMEILYAWEDALDTVEANFGGIRKMTPTEFATWNREQVTPYPGADPNASTYAPEMGGNPDSIRWNVDGQNQNYEKYRTNVDPNDMAMNAAGEVFDLNDFKFDEVFDLSDEIKDRFASVINPLRSEWNETVMKGMDPSNNTAFIQYVAEVMGSLMKAETAWANINAEIDNALNPMNEYQAGVKGINFQFDQYIATLKELEFNQASIDEMEARRKEVLEAYAGKMFEAADELIAPMGNLERQAYALKTQFDDWVDGLKELEDSEAKVALMEEKRQAAYANFISSILSSSEELVAPMSAYAKQVDDINNQFDDWISGLEELGGEQENINKLEEDRIEILRRLHQEYITSIQELQAEIGGTLDAFQFQQLDTKYKWEGSYGSGDDIDWDKVKSDIIDPFVNGYEGTVKATLERLDIPFEEFSEDMHFLNDAYKEHTQRVENDTKALEEFTSSLAEVQAGIRGEDYRLLVMQRRYGWEEKFGGIPSMRVLADAVETFGRMSSVEFYALAERYGVRPSDMLADFAYLEELLERQYGPNMDEIVSIMKAQAKLNGQDPNLVAMSMRYGWEEKFGGIPSMEVLADAVETFKGMTPEAVAELADRFDITGTELSSDMLILSDMLEKNTEALEQGVAQYNRMLEYFQSYTSPSSPLEKALGDIRQVFQSYGSDDPAWMTGGSNERMVMQAAFERDFLRPMLASLSDNIYSLSKGMGSRSAQSLMTGLSGSDEDYVKQAYRTLFGREADSGGLDHYLSILSGGMSRDSLLDTMVGATLPGSDLTRLNILTGNREGMLKDTFTSLAQELEGADMFEDQIDLLNKQYQVLNEIKEIQKSQLEETIFNYKAIQSTIDELRGGSLSPVQSLEYYQTRYSSLLSGAMGGGSEEIAALNAFVGEYADFMQAYGGDYNTFVQGVIGNLEGLQGVVSGGATLDDLESQLEALNQGIVQGVDKNLQDILQALMGIGGELVASRLSFPGNGVYVVPEGFADNMRYPGYVPIGFFASGGDHKGGWRVVGERGPELELTGASRIYSAPRVTDMLSKALQGAIGGDTNLEIKVQVGDREIKDCHIEWHRKDQDLKDSLRKDW
jgi:tape measure domain-containing protein